jgi:hypothetical protein
MKTSGVWHSIIFWNASNHCGMTQVVHLIGAVDKSKSNAKQGIAVAAKA